MSSNAFAQLFVDLGKVQKTVRPGQNISSEVFVHNTSNQPFEVRVYWEDFRYEPPFDGTKTFLPAGTGKKSLHQWINYSPKEFTLPAFGKKRISYILNVPPDIKGGYYGVLFFEKQAKENRSTRGLSIVARVGSLFFIESVNKDKDLKIREWTFQGKNLTAKVLNNSDVIVIPSAVYYVMDKAGIVVSRLEAEKLYLPPESEGKMILPLSESLDNEKYSLVVTIDLGDDDVVVREIDIEKNGAAQFNVLRVRE